MHRRNLVKSAFAVIASAIGIGSKKVAASRPMDTWGKGVHVKIAETGKEVVVWLMFIPRASWEQREESKDPAWGRMQCPIASHYLIVFKVERATQSGGLKLSPTFGLDEGENICDIYTSSRGR